MRIALNNFRAFAETPDIEIKPITVLVGENSTGKTSLLAAMRFALQLSGREDTSFFNVYPFDLGPYEDIVHSLGHPSSRKRFSLTLEKYVSLTDSRRFPLHREQESHPVLVRTTFFFKSQFGETALSSIRMQFDESQMDFHLDDGPRLTTITGSNRTEYGQADLFDDFRLRESLNLENSLYLLMQFRYAREGDSIRIRDDDIGTFVGLYDAFITNNYNVISSPPVRSVPRKVYTSSDEQSHKDGGNAPHDLSKIKRSDKRRWERINQTLNRFGKISGLFTRFDIKKLTTQDSGPFQVKVTVRNRASAIADVGYGVSQSLPIMTDLIVNQGKRSALLLQQPEVHLHPRAQAELGSIFVEHISKNRDSLIIVETHSDHLIDRIRIEVKEGAINPSLVNIVFLEANGNDVEIHQLSVDKYGNILNSPPGYRDFFIREQERILGY